MRDEDRSFTDTIPDLERHLRVERSDEWQREAFRDIARAGRSLEKTVERLRERIDSLERERAERKGMAKTISWLWKIAVGIGGFLAGQHYTHR
jgi:hypothetical protein